MPGEDQNDGGTPDPKTYSEEEMATAIAGAKKEGATESYTHFQSVADKEIAKERTSRGVRESELTKTIETLKADVISNLPESERLGAMVEEMYKDRHGEKSSSQEPDKESTKDQEFDQAGYAKEMQEAIGTALEGLGLDPKKVNWGDGQNSADAMKTFLASVVDQAKDSKDDPDPDGKNDDKGGDKKGSNNVDTSRGAGNAHDILQTDPKELITSEKWEPIRGMIEE